MAWSTAAPMTVSMPLTEAAEPPLWQMPTRVPCEVYSLAMRSRSSTDTPVISAYSSMVYSFTVSVRSEKPVRTVDAVHLALEFERALAARGVQRRLPGGGVDDHVLLDRLAVLVLLLGRVDAGVRRAHELAVVRMVLVDDDQVRGVRVGAVPALDGRLLGGEGDGIGVVGLVGDDLLHERGAERGVRGGLDGYPVDARDGGRHGTVGERESSTSILSFPVCEVLERALAGALEVDLLPPGKAPSQIAYSASSGSGVRPFLPACASELADLATAQLLACP